MSLALLFHLLTFEMCWALNNVSTSILRSLWLICWVISWVVLLWFDVCWCYSVVWLGWSGILMQASACIRIPHHPSRSTPWHQHTSSQSNTTHEITQQISHKLLRMDVLTFETCWAVNGEIIKQVTSSWSVFIQLYRSFMNFRKNVHPEACIAVFSLEWWTLSP